MVFSNYFHNNRNIWESLLSDERNRVKIPRCFLDKMGHTMGVFTYEKIRQAFARRIRSRSVWTKQGTKPDKKRCTVDKIGHLPNFVDTTGQCQTFSLPCSAFRERDKPHSLQLLVVVQILIVAFSVWQPTLNVRNNPGVLWPKSCTRLISHSSSPALHVLKKRIVKLPTRYMHFLIFCALLSLYMFLKHYFFSSK